MFNYKIHAGFINRQLIARFVCFPQLTLEKRLLWSTWAEMVPPNLQLTGKL